MSQDWCSSPVISYHYDNFAQFIGRLRLIDVEQFSVRYGHSASTKVKVQSQAYLTLTPDYFSLHTLLM